MSPEENIVATETATVNETETVTDYEPSDIDFDKFSDAELAQIEANNGVIPDELQSRLSPDESTEQEPDEPGEPDEPARPDEPDETDTDEPDTPAAAEFRFTENADDETFQRETDEFLSRFEETPELENIRSIVEGYRSRLGAAAEQVQKIESLGDLETVSQTQSAIDAMVTRTRQDDSGVFVADTSDFRRVMRERYENEFEQVLEDELSAPSEKYHGASRMEELVFDGFGFTEPRKQRELVEYLSSGGQLQIPPFIPEGIDNSVAEAFWKSIDRTEIEAKLDEYNRILEDDSAYDSEKEDARRGISAINQKLVQIQTGLNADRASLQQKQQQQAAQAQALDQKVMENYATTAITLEREFSDKIASKLTMLGGADNPGARVTGRAVANLVRDALSEGDMFPEAARADLKAMGINFDWKKGFDTLDRLYHIEKEITYKEANPNKYNPRSIEISKRAKADILREIKAQETELIGKIMPIIQSGANRALTAKSNAPQNKGVRLVAKNATGGMKNTNDIDSKFAHLTDEELAKLAEAEEMMRRQKAA